MLLAHALDNPQINLSLEVFLREARDLLSDDLVSVVIFGSAVFDDLCPGYSDLDFLAVMEDDPSEDRFRRLIDLRKPLRSGDYGIYCHMIEGPFLPVRMLDPNEVGRTVCWGTSGERVWEKNRLGWFVHHIIHRYGLTVYGEDIRPHLPDPTREMMLEEISGVPRDMREHGKGGGAHSVDWLLLAARTLLWLKEGRITGKSQAADWAVTHARGEWKESLPLARDVRRNPSLADSPEVARWLESLAKPIEQASEEVRAELAAAGAPVPDR